MKKLVQVSEVEGEGLIALLGKPVMIWCMNYVYWGTLEGVNDSDLLLKNAHVVYETGKLTGELKDAQPLPNVHYIRLSAIESYGEHAG